MSRSRVVFPVCSVQRPLGHHRPLSVAVGLALASACTVALAQGREARTSSVIEEVEVVGQRLAITEAARRKREAANLRDITASDDIGRLPDLNIGDALSRLPGVSTDQFEGEARFVNIRGLDPSLNNLTLDGVQIATGDDRGRDGRSAALDGISTSGIAAIEVIKTPTPDMDGVGIGGTINIISPSAFSRDRAFYGARLDTSQSSVSDTSVFDWLSAEIFGGNVFGPEQNIGVFASLDVLRRDRLVRDRADNVNWRPAGDELLPIRLDITRFPIKRERINFTTNLEYRPSDTSELFLRGLYTNDQRTITNRVVEQWNTRGAFTSTGDGTFEGPVRLTLDGWEREQENETFSLTAGGGHELTRDLRVDYALAWARAVSDRPLWVQNRFQTGNFPGRLIVDEGVRFEALDPEFFTDPSNYRLQRVRIDSIDTRERILSPKVDLSWQTRLAGFDTLVRTGAKATFRDKSVDARSDRFRPTEVLTLADNNFGLPGAGRPGYPFGGSWFQGAYTGGVAVNNQAVLDYFFANRDLFTFSEAESIANNLEDDFNTDEDVYAGYLMAQLDTGPMLWTVGARLEYTDYTSEAARVTFVDGDITSIEDLRETRSYTDILPNLQLRYELQENVILRAAWTQAIGRPDFVAAAPIQEFEVDRIGTGPDGEGIFTASLSTGNPQLDRFRANNFDVSVEYYPSATSVFAAAGFYKRIRNPIFDLRETQFDTSFGGFDLEVLQIRTSQNAEAGRVSGLELTAQDQFTFLPAPFDNFGASVNLTLVSSSSNVIGRDDSLPFFGQADRIFNAALFYQQEGFEARLAYRRRSEFLEALGGNPDQDIFRDSYRQLDFRTSYRFANGLSVSLDAWNLTNEQPRVFQGIKSRFWGLEDTGRIYTLGVQWAM
ncbi:MAG: TonB-dependent receptor [Gammaproteobacteria bacterium]|nr:MAG: TonB-dependent receptor [Gammaproteobacteria bacterium]